MPDHTGRQPRTQRTFEPLEARVLLAANPLITEFLSSGNQTLLDVDGEFHDWIEIQNTGDMSIDLAGYSLTDEDTTGNGTGTPVLKWQFPSKILDPGAYLVVFASSKNRAVSGHELHTNFQLASTGEYLALVAPNGTDVVSEFRTAFPQQLSGISYGLADKITVTDRTYATTGAAASVHVPTDNQLNNDWTRSTYVEGTHGETWTTGSTGIGYDHAPSLDYTNLINTDIGTEMRNVSPAALVRVPFNVDKPPSVTELSLDMEYDDAFVAYLNGTQVARQNASVSPTWDSTAIAEHSANTLTAGTVHDIAADYNQLDNPTGAWSYRDGIGNLVSDNITVGPDGDFPAGQPAWRIVSGCCPIIFQSSTAQAHDMPPGRVGGHGPFEIHWTAPDSGVVDITGGSWQPRDLNRSLQISLLHNDQPIFNNVAQPERDAGITSDNTFSFADAATTAGGQATDLTGIAVNSGDVFRFIAMGNEFLGVDMTFTYPDQGGALEVETFDLTPHVGALTAGNNILAIHGLNHSIDSDAFLVRPSLTGQVTTGQLLVGEPPRFFSQPTPGAPNGVGTQGLGLDGGLIINEFSANNKIALQDQDNDNSDWVELYNATSIPLGLDGYYLSTRPGNLTQWQFPEVTINPKDYLVVFASGKDRTENELHTNFKLDSRGEYLALVAPDGQTVLSEFSPNYPPQYPDASYGMITRTTTETLIGPAAASRTLVPTNNSLGTSWTDVNFADQSWIAGTTGAGFDADTSIDITSSIGTDLQSQMLFQQTTAMLRVPFNVTDPTNVESLDLSLDYDDGAIIYLNGQEVLRRNAPASVEFDSVANASHPAILVQSVAGTTFDVAADFDINASNPNGPWSYRQSPSGNLILDNVTVGPDGDFPSGQPAWRIGGGCCPIVFKTSTPQAHDFPQGRLGVHGSAEIRFTAPESGTLEISGGFWQPRDLDRSVNVSLIHEGNTLFSVPAPDRSSTGVTSANPMTLATAAGDPNILKDISVNANDEFLFKVDGGEFVGFDLAVTYLDGGTQQVFNTEHFDLSQHRDLLQSGKNVLAIHGLNHSIFDSTLLIKPELTLSRKSSAGLALRYFSSPTPGEANGSNVLDQGPLISDLSHTPQVPTDAEDILVTATVQQSFDNIQNVNLVYRVMYGSEKTVTMFDDGNHGDGIAGDDVYGATIPANESSPGEMVRYYVTATDTNSKASRWPLFNLNAGSPEYFGTMVSNPLGSNDLPVIEWFIENSSAPDQTGWGGGRAAVFFLGELYDNVFVRHRGRGILSKAKKSFKFDFNGGYDFRFDLELPRVTEININSTYFDKAYLRQSLSWEVMRKAGLNAPHSFPVRVNQNGQFYSVAALIEHLDESFLESNGLDPAGALYKFIESNKVEPEGGSSLVRKITRKDEGRSDIQQVYSGVAVGNPNRSRFLFDNINIPQVINYIAAGVIPHHHDRGHHNYYLYHDTNGNGEWSVFPWDLDLTWGVPQLERDDIYADNHSSSHPLLSDEEHKWSGSVDWNILIDAMHSNSTLREMFMRRLRTLMDDILQPAETPVQDRFLETRIEQMRTQMEADVLLDRSKWGTLWGINLNFDAALATILDDYLVRRRPHLYVTHAMGNSEVATEINLVSEGAAAAALVPGGPDDLQNGGSDWKENNFVETAAWQTGTTAVGYDRSPDYQSLIGLDVLNQFDPDGDPETANVNDSLLVRVPFSANASDLANGDLDTLTLRMKYDDVFVAYINGVEVASSAGVPAPLQWNSAGQFNYSDSSATTFRDYTINLSSLQGGSGAIVAGNQANVLAIHGLNDETNAGYGMSSDMLVSPALVLSNAPLGAVGGGDGLIPTAQVGNPLINFGQVNDDDFETAGEIVFNPISGNQDEEYISLVNPNSTAVDISGWQLTGGVEMTFQPGTVIAAGGTLYVSPNVKAFRARASGPRAGLQMFVQGDYAGHISSFGETIQLVAADGSLINSVTTPTLPTDVQKYLRVSEVHYNPAGSDETEFIELTNISSGAQATTLDLSGAMITDGPSTPFTFPNGTTLTSGGHVLVVKNQTVFQTAYPLVSSSLIAGQFSGSLSNGGETIVVDDAQGSTVLSFTYNDNDPWAERADGNGASLELIDPAATSTDLLNKHYHWRGSTELGGSPGNAGQGPQSVVINELLAHTDPPVAQSDSVELLNTGSSPLDIGGWYLSDSANNLLKYSIAANTLLGPGQYLVFDEDDFNPTPLTPGLNDFSLSGTRGDDVYLVDPNGGGTGVMWIIDDVHFGSTANGESLGRVPNGQGRLTPLKSKTLGAVNSSPRIGPVVISELNYNPGSPTSAALASEPTLTDNDLEFIEINNLSSASVDLTDWRIAGVDFDFPAGTTIGSAGVLLVLSFDPTAAANANRLTALVTHYGISTGVTLIGPYQGQLSNSEELIRLQRPGTPPADEPGFIPRLSEDGVLYDDLTPWPTAADGTGQSLHRMQLKGSGYVASNWSSRAPSPGQSVRLGDTDFDGDVDTSDLTTAIMNFTGAGGQGKTWSQGDLDGDGDVDTSDLTVAIINFTGARADSGAAASAIIQLDGVTGNASPARSSLQLSSSNDDRPTAVAAPAVHFPPSGSGKRAGGIGQPGNTQLLDLALANEGDWR